MNIKSAAVFGGILLCSAATSFAIPTIPTLQLDVHPGVYNNTDQSTYSTSSHFDLVALLNGPLDSSRPYYISAALEPMAGQQSPPPNGSFKLGNTVYSVANLSYGTPPLNSGIKLDPHNEFPTYFTEYEFNFDSLHTVAAYDVPTGQSAPGTLYAYDLSVDTSPLLAGYSLHFDLYDLKTNADGRLVVDEVAPFTHDAQSGTVPDGGATWLLLGAAICGLVFVPKMRPVRIKVRR